MSDLPPTETNASPTASVVSSDKPQLPTPQRCIFGSAIAGIMAYAMYMMTMNIAQSFATHKIQSTSQIVQRISAAVRTLVVGMTTLGMGVFGLAAIGLFLLAMQILIQRRNQSSSNQQ
jgi:hypothetical protein